MEQVVEELHRPARRNYPRRKYDIRGIDETWQADLVEMRPDASMNNGNKYMMTVIDTFSKYAWAVPLKSKSGPDVTAAMKSILVQGRVPKNLQVDQGKEFYNRNFKELMKKYNINLYSTYSNVKASIVERFNRTLQTIMWKQFSLLGNHRWVKILPDLLAKYNSSVHRTIGVKPKDVNSKNEAEILKRFSPKAAEKRTKPKFKVGDHVRASKYKTIFEKGFTPNWSTEIFTITRVKRTHPYTYLVKDYRDQPIKGSFYEQELTKVRYPDVYLVEKVLKRRKDQVYVKWLGFDSTHNSWIDKNQL